jgi:hypothetical protein
MCSSVGLIVLFALGAIAALVVSIVWHETHPNKAENGL